MPQCVSKMVQVSNLYLQRGAAKLLNKALLKFGCKTINLRHDAFSHKTGYLYVHLANKNGRVDFRK